MDDEQSTYTTEELQALTRNIDFQVRRLYKALPPQQLVNDIKGELNAYGLQFAPRNAIKHFRGSMSSGHGTSPYAGMGGGGSGMGSDRSGPIGFGFGGGPGAIGSGEKWDPNDKKNLPIRGSRR
jgi:hypothetical protein